MLGQRAPRWLGAALCGGLNRLGNCPGGGQGLGGVLLPRFDCELKLLDRALILLGRAAKLSAFEPSKLEAKLRDLGTGNSCIARHLANHAPERIDIIRQCCRINRHTTYLAVSLSPHHENCADESSCRTQPASCGRSVRIGARQSIPSSNIASCAGVSAAPARGHVARPQ